jgi:hypothetical protein
MLAAFLLMQAVARTADAQSPSSAVDDARASAVAADAAPAPDSATSRMVYVVLAPRPPGLALRLHPIGEPTLPDYACQGACTVSVARGVDYKLALVDTQGRVSRTELQFRHPQRVELTPPNRSLLLGGTAIFTTGAVLAGVSVGVFIYGVAKNLLGWDCTVDCGFVSDGVFRATTIGMVASVPILATGAILVFTNLKPGISTSPLPPDGPNAVSNRARLSLSVVPQRTGGSPFVRARVEF